MEQQPRQHARRQPQQEQPRQLEQQQRVSVGLPRLSVRWPEMLWVMVTQAAASARQKDGAACSWPQVRAHIKVTHFLW